MRRICELRENMLVGKLDGKKKKEEKRVETKKNERKKRTNVRE